MKKRQIIDADKPLSKSLIWQIQREYFLKNGLKAWQDDIVPSAISINPVMARAYSQVVFGYLRDCFAAVQQGAFALDAAQPIYIVELGAGSGRLAHHFLQTFFPRYRESPFAGQPIKYVMTDFVPEIVGFWQSHPKLQFWVEAGLLDFALFDVEAMRPFQLKNSGETLSPDSVQNPVILIANYFFDSIPQDSFVIEDGLLCQNLLTLSSSQPEPDLADPTIWERLRLHYEAIPLQKPYNNSLYNQILDEYEATLPDTAVSFPNVGLDCLEFLRGFGNGRLLILSSDRGYSQVDSLVGQGDPALNLHGSFSLMVNYTAVSRYVELRGGMVCQVPHYQDNIQTLAYLLGDVSQEAAETRLAFDQAVGWGGPDDFYALKSVAEKQVANMTLPELLSFLRFSGWDAELLRDCLPHLRKLLENCDPAWHPDVYNALQNIRQLYLPLYEPDALLGEVDALCLLLQKL